MLGEKTAAFNRRQLRGIAENEDGLAKGEEIAAEVGVARVTARRYLEYLEVIGNVEVTRERNGPGRPRNRYRQSTGVQTGSASSEPAP